MTKRKFTHRLAGVLIAGILAFEGVDLTVFASENHTILTSELNLSAQSEDENIEESHYEECIDIESEISENEKNSASDIESEMCTFDQETFTEGNEECGTYEQESEIETESNEVQPSESKDADNQATKNIIRDGDTVNLRGLMCYSDDGNLVLQFEKTLVFDGTEGTYLVDEAGLGNWEQKYNSLINQTVIVTGMAMEGHTQYHYRKLMIIVDDIKDIKGLPSVSGKCGDNLTWTLEGGTLTISGTGEMYDYKIKSEVGDEVTTAPWAEYNYALERLIIDEGITSIGDQAFWECDGFKGELKIPNSVTSIGMAAFSWCSGFSGNLKIPDNLTVIEDFAFSGCSGFSGNLKIPNDVTSIGDSAFYFCSGFSGSLKIPDSVTSIGDRAFFECTGLTDVYISETLNMIEENPFEYFNGSTSECTNLNITFHCPKDSYAYSWAFEKGFPVVEWENDKEDVADVIEENIKINGQGYAYATFLLKDNKGEILRNQKITYNFGGKNYSAVSDQDGYVVIKSEKLSNHSNNIIEQTIRTSEIILDTDGTKLDYDVIMQIEIEPFTYTQTWSFGIKGSLEGGLNKGIGVRIGDAEAKASLGNASVTASGKGTVSLEEESVGDIKNIRLEQNLDCRAGLKYSIGPEAKAGALGQDITMKALTISGEGSVGESQGIALKINNYDPNNTNQIVDIGKFGIAMIGQQTGNMFLLEIVDRMGLDLYNMTDKSVGIYAKAGADIGSIQYGGKDIGKVFGLGQSASYVYTVGRDDVDHTYSKKSEIECNVDSEFAVTPITKPVVSSSYAGGCLVHFVEDDQNILKKMEIGVKTFGETTELWKERRIAKGLSLEFDAKEAQRLKNTIKELEQIENGELPLLFDAKNTILKKLDESGASGTYSRSLKTTTGNSWEFSLIGSMGAELGVGISLEGLYDLQYDTERGIYKNGYIIKTSEVVEETEFLKDAEFDDIYEFFTQPMKIFLDKAKNYLIDIWDNFSKGIQNAYASVKSAVKNQTDAVKNWVVHIVRVDWGKSRTFNSYGIMAVNSSAEEETEKVVFTIGDSYYVYVTDDTEEIVENFEKCPLELTLEYTDEMLVAAGVSQNDANSISIYKYSEELCGYVCIGGTVDANKHTVSANITESGQYLLATDTTAPLVYNVEVSVGTNKPVITVYFDEISGFKQFSIKLDGKEVVNTSDWMEHYNVAYSSVSYQVDHELEEGYHTVSAYAVDSAGNAMPKPYQYRFAIGEVDEPESSGEVLPEDVPADGIIPDGLWIAGVSDQTYTGEALKPKVRVYDHDKRLQAGKDYTITYKNNKNANDATDTKKAPTITVKGKGNYAGTETATFKIHPVSLTDQAISAEAVTTAYSNKLQKPVPVITFNGKKLKNKTDFTLSYPDTGADAYKESGTYRIKVTGKGNFAGELEVPFVITNNMLITKTKISTIPAQPYNNGQPVEPTVTVKFGNTALTKDTDYTISYANNREIGTAYVVLTGIGKYAGTKKVSFKIIGTSIKNAVVEGLSDGVYTGSPYTPDIKLTLNGKQLVKDTDYKLTCTNNVNAGTVSIKIEGINAYSGTIQKKCKVIPYDIGSNPQKLLKDDTGDIAAKYTKGGTTPQPQLTFGTENEKLVEGRDYTITYKNNQFVTAVGKAATMTIKGKGNFKGTITKYFTIQAKALTDAESPVTLTIPDKVYTDKAGKYKSSPVLMDTNGNKLKAGTDYDKAIVYTLSDGTEMTAQSKPEAGTTIHVKVTGRGAYTGTIEGDYLITKADFNKAKITIQPQVYTGREIIPDASAITVKVTGNSTPLVYGTDYEIVAGSCKDNINKGTATITIKGKGNYGGTKTVKFKITARNMKWFWRLFG